MIWLALTFQKSLILQFYHVQFQNYIKDLIPLSGSQYKMQNPNIRDTIQIGHAYFKPTLTKSALLQMLTQERENTLQSETWMIQGSSQQSKWSDIFPLMQTAQNIYLQMLYGYLRQSFFEEISHIQFVNLKKINLYNNQIANIEGILYLDCPQLKSIEFSQNKVTIISKFFSKMYFPKLQQIDCQVNMFSDAQLGRFFSKSNQMNISIVSAENSTSAVENVNVCAKTPLFGPITSVQLYRFQPSKSAVDHIKNIKQNRLIGVFMKKTRPQKSKQ